MEELELLQMRITYGTLKDQRDDALDHSRLCFLKRDYTMAHFWSNIYRDSVHDMAELRKEYEKRIKERSKGDKDA